MSKDRKEYMRQYRQEHREAKRATDRNWKQKHRRELNEKACQTKHLIKVEVLSYYSTNNYPICARCGIADIDVLCLDHIRGGGLQRKRELSEPTGAQFYRWLKKNNYPEGLQVLCFNCNFRKRLVEEKWNLT